MSRFAVAGLVLGSSWLASGIRIDGELELGGRLSQEEHAELAMLEQRQMVAVREGAVFQVTHEELQAASQDSDLLEALASGAALSGGQKTDWFYRWGCGRLRFSDRKTEQFFFQVYDGNSAIASRLTRDAKSPTLEIYQDRDWHAKLNGEGGVDFTAVPKDANNTQPKRTIQLFKDVSAVEFTDTRFDSILKFNGTDLTFVDGLYLEPHIVALGLRESGVVSPTAATQQQAGSTFAMPTTRWHNYTRTGAAQGFKVGKYVSPVAGVSAAIFMASVGVGTAVLGTMVGVAGFAAGGFTLGGIRAGVEGIGQSLGLTKRRVLTERIGAANKIWKELRCMRGYSTCRARWPEEEEENPAFNLGPPVPTDILVLKGAKCPKV